MGKNLDNTDPFFLVKSAVWKRADVLFEFKPLSKCGCMGTFIKCSETSCSGHNKDQDLELETKG